MLKLCINSVSSRKGVYKYLNFFSVFVNNDGFSPKNIYFLLKFSQFLKLAKHLKEIENSSFKFPTINSVPIFIQSHAFFNECEPKMETLSKPQKTFMSQTSSNDEKIIPWTINLTN